MIEALKYHKKFNDRNYFKQFEYIFYVMNFNINLGILYEI